MRGYWSCPYSPYKMPKPTLCKMPRHRWCKKMPRHESGPYKTTDTSGPYKMRGQRSDPSDIPAQRSGGSKVQGYKSRPHKTRPGKMA